MVSGDAEEHADLLAQLVDEDHRGVGGVEATRELAQRLRHQASLQTHVGVAHLALDLGLGHECCDGVDHDEVDRAGADQHVGDLERLLAGVGLRHEQLIDVDAELAGVLGVECVLGVDERGDTALLLHIGDRVERERRLSGGLRAVDLDDAATRESADAECDVEGDRTGGDHLDRCAIVAAQPHDRALSELPVDLGESRFEGLLAVFG